MRRGLITLFPMFLGCYEPGGDSAASDGGSLLDAAHVDASNDSTTPGDSAVAPADSSVPDTGATDTGPASDAGTAPADSGIDTAPVDAGCVCSADCCPGKPPLGTCCASGACPTLHNAGFGFTYWYCGAKGTPGNAGTYNVEMAKAAARAYRAGSSVTTPGGFCSGTIAVNNPTVSGTETVSWSFATGAAGHAKSVVGSVPCPTASDEPWD